MLGLTQLQCDANVPRILEYERRKQEVIRLKEEAWQNCTTPVERALQDPERFVNFHFLTNGRPDRTKTTEPFALYGYGSSNHYKILNRAEHITGL
jgi:hypothetical protein